MKTTGPQAFEFLQKYLPENNVQVQRMSESITDYFYETERLISRLWYEANCYRSAISRSELPPVDDRQMTAQEKKRYSADMKRFKALTESQIKEANRWSRKILSRA
jgi:hypothetical protein